MYARSNIMKIWIQESILNLNNIAQKASRNTKQKQYPSSSVYAEKADGPFLEKELNSDDFGCFGLGSGAQVGSPGLSKNQFHVGSLRILDKGCSSWP